MKTTKNSPVILVLAVLVSLTAGFLVGILVDFPKTDDTQLAGTIGRVQNYKNVKVTEEDIELKNDLVSDTIILKAMSNYFNYYYVAAVSQGEKIRYALEALESQPAYKEHAGLLLQEVSGYGAFLGNARLDLLQAVAVVTNPAEIHPVMMRNTIVQANNVISQISFRRQSVLDLIDNLGNYLEKQGKDADATLASVHTVLSLEQITNAMALNDKMVLKYFEKKKIFTEQIQGSFGSELQGLIVADAQRLGVVYYDIDPMGIIVQSAESIGSHFALNSGEIGSMITNMHELGICSEVIGSSNDLESVAFMNMENLDLKSSLFSEQLGGAVLNTPDLGMFNNMQELGFLNVTQLNYVIKMSELGGAIGIVPPIGY